MIYGTIIEYNSKLITGVIRDDDNVFYNFFNGGLVSFDINLGTRVMFEQELEHDGIRWAKGVTKLNKETAVTTALDDFA